MSNLISIITPAYNAARHIAETIDSVRAQTHADWEMLIVDDGSTDSTKEIVQRYCSLDSRIHYFYQPNGRQGKARNNGLSRAQGEYVAFLDSDDLWLPTMLAAQLQQLQATSADLVFSDAYVFSDNFDSTVATQKLNTERNTFAGDAGLAAFLIGNRIPILTVLCKRGAVEKAGRFTEDPLIQNAEDYHLWLKMLATGSTFSGLDHTLAAYRKHTTSVSSFEGLNHNQGIEARYALSISHPEKFSIVKPAVTHAIVTNLVYIKKLPANELYAALDRYLEIGGKTMWRPLFKLYKRVQMNDVAIRSTYFIFNHL